MKFVKFLPALATVIIALPTYAKAAPTVTDKTVVYSCNKKTVMQYINSKTKNLLVQWLVSVTKLSQKISLVINHNQILRALLQVSMCGMWIAV